MTRSPSSGEEARGRERRPLAARLYAACLAAYPAPFRDRYGAEALDLFKRLHRDARAHGRAAALRFTLAAAARALAGASIERLVGDRHPLAGDPTGPVRHLRRSPMRHDIRFALRALRKRPESALTVVLLLATGIGAATAVFSVVNGVVLEALPYPDGDRLVYVTEGSHNPADFLDWNREVGSVDRWAAVRSDRLALTGDGTPEQLEVGRVSADVFGLFGIRPTLGRAFTPEEYGPGADVAVVSRRAWRQRWGGDPDLVGRDIRLGGRPVRIVGVVDGLPPEIMVDGQTDVFMPLDLQDPEYLDRGFHVLDVVGRLAEGVTIEAADREMELMAGRLAERFPDSHLTRDGEVLTTPLVPLAEAEVGPVRGTLFMLLGASGLLLLIACANVANLLLAQGTSRTREMALRGALGADRRNMISQLGAESLLLSLAGGILGTGIAFGAVRLFRLLEPGSLPRVGQVALDGRVLLFALAISLVTGVLFGVLPALRAARIDANEVLKRDTGTSTSGRSRTRLQSALVVAEVALSMILLTGAGVLAHSLLTLSSVEPGFVPGRLLTVSLGLDERSADERRAFVDEILPRLRALPGAEGVAGGTTLPFQYANGGSCCWITDVEPPAGEGTGARTSIRPVLPAYFTTMGTPLVAGRDLVAADARETPVPVVLNESAARELFQTTDVVGRTLAYSTRQARVIGVAADVRYIGFEYGTRPEMYTPWTLDGAGMLWVSLAIRTSADPAPLAAGVRAAIWSQDADLPIQDLVTMEGRMGRAVATERFYLALLGGFAGIALLLAAGGLYATLLYSVRQRRREMGIRLALGARGTDIVGLVLRRGLTQTAIGLAIGLGGALLGVRVLESLVFQISTRDPRTLAVVSGLLAAVALVACLAPAIRAGRTDPAETLRAD